VVVAGDEDFDYDSWPPGIATPTHLYICGGNGFEDAGAYYVDDLEIWDELPSETPEDPPTTISVGGSGSVSFGGAP